MTELTVASCSKSTISEIIKILRLSISSWPTGKTKKKKMLEDEIKNKKDTIDEALKTWI